MTAVFHAATGFRFPAAKRANLAIPTATVRIADLLR